MQTLPSDAAVGTGRSGEDRAAEYLRRERGFGIVACNWRNPRDRREEIDLVARDGDVMVFVEVKARAAGARVPGYCAVDAGKKRVLRRACRAYLRNLRRKPRIFRFDVVEIEFAAGTPVVRHFQNIPLFSKFFQA